MKKLLAVLLVLALSCCLVACGSNDVSEESPNTSNSSSENVKEDVSDELSEEELEQAYQTLMSYSILDSQYKQLVNAGVYRDVSYGDIIGYTFSNDAKVTYSKYDEKTVVVEVSGPYRYAITDDSFAYSGMIQLYIHESGKITTRSDPNGILTFMRSMAQELASY